MEIRCPHCHNGVQIVENDSSLRDIGCESCGTHFSLVDTQPTAPLNRTTKTLGHFHLLEKLGVGAFGVVYKARDAELDRLVALKIPRDSQLSEGESEQFLREARAAAQLNHPNIVAVHEVGRIDDQLYIVADLVQGVTLDQWLRQKALTEEEAVELAVKVSRALQHAHDAGVIHRDLKPSNIMVDGAGEPHVMDFGLAKRVAGEITMTMEGQVLGTPAYMSPEQASGRAHEADCRTDVYSLGALLFEMVAGSPPFRGETQMLIHQVIFDEAPSPRKLNRRVSRDLETICLKCLEKKPERRYSTAAALADDLQRYLSGDPIVARPLGPLARGGRWCRKHVWAALVVATIVLSLVATSSVSTIAYVTTLQAYADAEDAHGRAEEAYRKAEQGRQQAIKGHQRARAAVDDLLTAVSEEQLLNQPGLQPVRKKLLEKALVYYTQFLEEQGPGGKLDQELALAYFRTGRVHSLLGHKQEAIEHLSRAAEMQKEILDRKPDDLDLIASIGNTMQALGREAQQRSQVYYQSARGYRAMLVDAEPDNVEYVLLLASTDLTLARWYKGKEKMQRYDSVRRRIESVIARGADTAGMAQYLLGLTHYNVAKYVHSLDEEENHLKRAAAAFQDAYGTRQDLPSKDYATRCVARIAEVCRRRGNMERARQLSDQAVEQAAMLARENPLVPSFQAAHAMSLINWAKVPDRDPQQAEEKLKRAVELSAKLLADNPTTGNHLALAKARLALATHYLDKGQPADARRALVPAAESMELVVHFWFESVDAFETRREIARQWVRAAPDEADAQITLAVALWDWPMPDDDDGRSELEQELLDSLRFLEALKSEHPSLRELLRLEASACFGLSMIQVDSEMIGAYLEQALSHWEHTDAQQRHDLFLRGLVLQRLACWKSRQGDMRESELLHARAIADLEAGLPPVPPLRPVSRIYQHSGVAEAQLGDADDSFRLRYSAIFRHASGIVLFIDDHPFQQKRLVDHYTVAINCRARLADELPDHPIHRQLQAIACRQFAIFYLETPRLSLRDQNTALRLAERASELDPGTESRQLKAFVHYRRDEYQQALAAIARQDFHAETEVLRALILFRLGQPDEGRKVYQDALLAKPSRPYELESPLWQEAEEVFAGDGDTPPLQTS